MKTFIVCIMLVFVLMAGCAIVPMPPPSVAISPTYRLQTNYYGWRSLGWESRGYGSRWVPGYQRWVCENSPRCYWTWEPAHYE